MKRKVIMFGSGGRGKTLYEKYKDEWDVMMFLDNDTRKDGLTLFDKPIHIPNEILFSETEFDTIIVSSIAGVKEIPLQLMKMGVPKGKIDTSYVDAPIISRDTFCKSLSSMNLSWDSESACAEAGVFRGDFAQVINQCFPERKLYLFDTFAGFDSRDVLIEDKNNFSKAAKEDYGFTSEKVVLDKMKYQDKCIIKKGYFPQSAQGIDEKFCFVNLDFDLYQPILEGLNWFSTRMDKNGVILVHDFFSVEWSGVKRAVLEFMSDKEKTLYLLPIGDGISVAIVGKWNLIS